jgi:uncharacterized protein with von Willebrand factor type A (vWA) domain
VDELEGTGEFIFLLDRSGSMTGKGIKLAKEAAIYFLKSLPSSCKFNVVSFGSRHKSMFPESVNYTNETLNQAVHQIQDFTADMGGTDIYSPLVKIFSEPPQFTRAVFLLTDGQVGNSE